MSANVPPSAAQHHPRARVRAFLNRPLVVLVLLSLGALALAYQLRFAADLSSPGVVLDGFYGLEGRSTGRPFQWTGDDAHVWLGGIGDTAYHLTITLSSARPNDVDLPDVRVLANDTLIGSFKGPRPIRDFGFDIPLDALDPSGDLDLQIESDTFAPPNDLRPLGVAVYGLRLETAPRAFPLTWPAPAPLAWGIIAVSMTYLTAGTLRLPDRVAWVLALLLLGILSVGIAVARTLAVEVLPWSVLVSVIAFVLGTTVKCRH